MDLNNERQSGNELKPVFADLHFHSKYSRAVSPDMDLEHLSQGAREKGLQVLGTGDFSHPKWFQELKEKLVEAEGFQGLFELKAEASKNLPFAQRVFFMLTNEVATFYSHKGKSRKVHHILHAPSFDEVAQLNEKFSKRSNLSADGRPMFASTSCAEMSEMFHSCIPKGSLVPAHSWTPYFGVFGSNSGYDSLKEAFEDQAKNIFAIETGMSSDPAMNWRLSQLDGIALMSNSDSHSPYPWRLGRECNAFAISQEKLSFHEIFDAVKKKDERFAFTVEVNPSYGKYHIDGHRLCNFSCEPAQTKKLNGICPVCKQPLTIGVLSRVEELADRPYGFVPKNAVPFKTLLPLHEILAAVYASTLASKTVAEQAQKLYAALGSEFEILFNAPKEKLEKVVHEKAALAILENREGLIQVAPGFDGEYGQAKLSQDLQLRQAKKREQKNNQQKENEKKQTAPQSAQEKAQKSLSDF